ncbi:MAG: homoserine kinase [Alphaproteobacteria bacterium]|nr:homoserine kinase [Alphaproteobacteria bacterium]
MAVYTEVTDDDLLDFVARYDVGTLVSYKGIAEGIENSNYLVQTDRAAFILTLYERRVNAADLPYFIGLMDHLAAQGFTCPRPIRARDGAVLASLCGRPAAMVSFLTGMWPKRILPRHCGAIGATAATLHRDARDFPMRRANDLSLAGWQRLHDDTRARAHEVQPGLAEALEAELAHLARHWPSALPEGVIHADLFPDNVFFLGETLSGVIDFYFACNDFLAYELAICLNAWCFEPDASFNVTKARLLLAGYAKVRPLEPAEIAALPLLARGAAIRFLLTRLYDWINHPEGALVRRKDPLEYLHRLRFHQSVADVAAYGLG